MYFQALTFGWREAEVSERVGGMLYSSPAHMREPDSEQRYLCPCLPTLQQGKGKQKKKNQKAHFALLLHFFLPFDIPLA